MKKNALTVLFIMAVSMSIFGQNAPFTFKLEPISIEGLFGVQSFAFGQANGKWLIIGGRLDGLHKRQPFASFDVAGHNNQLIVIDPITKQKWTTPLTSLSVGIQEQLSSTNMEFYQQDSILYFIGGYGYSNTAFDHVTYSNLAAINVPMVINAVINGSAFNTYIKQITDSKFAVTGGRLEKIYNTFYLVGGQKFDGRYNPMNNPTFTQAYTSQIRKFTINNTGNSITVNHFPAITDTANLHRRDYNVLPQIMPNGQEGLTAFSGVFQTKADIPYLNCVNIDSSGYTVNNAFSQYYNHYHCANLHLYSAKQNEMHSVFFGGIAQYFDSLGVLVQDNNAPFVKTIARVTRNGNGVMTEYKLPIEMPALLGAGSELIPIEYLTSYPNKVLKLDNILTDTTLVGYIFGGINSSDPNIFNINSGSQSSANNQLFKVLLIKNGSVGIDKINNQSNNSFQMQVYPNPNQGNFKIKFVLKQKSSVKISIFDLKGKELKNEEINNFSIGENNHSFQLNNQSNIGTYIITIKTDYESATQKVIIHP
jgi:hypothetical protein